MKILHINSMVKGSTGKIMMDLCEFAENNNIEAYFAYPSFDGKLKKKAKNQIIIGNYLDSFISHIFGRITGLNDYLSCISTWIFIKKINKLDIQIIHLHNLHNCYINLKILFDYLKSKKIPIVWTLHDCWSFTAKCPYFDYPKCDKWKNGCYNCQQLHKYPKCYIDNTKILYSMKKANFTGLEKLLFVTPSQWLSNLLEDSFLKNYNKQVVNNGCNLEIFKPRNSDFKKRYNIEDKFVILGVAHKWEARKGLEVFIDLYNNLDKSKYQIVLVGIDKKIKDIPNEIISIERTENQIELSEIYSMADVFFNPTREENFCLVNIESIACGTPVITFDSGGCSEIIDENSGIVLKKNNWNEAKNIIEKMYLNVISFEKELCIKRATAFDQNKKYSEYLQLYRLMIEK